MQAINTGTVKKEKQVAAWAIIAGIILYLSKFLRSSFTGNDPSLFMLGILPNFGLAFTGKKNRKQTRFAIAINLQL